MRGELPLTQRGPSKGKVAEGDCVPRGTRRRAKNVVIVVLKKGLENRGLGEGGGATVHRPHSTKNPLNSFLGGGEKGEMGLKKKPCQWGRLTSPGATGLSNSVTISRRGGEWRGRHPNLHSG